MSRRVGHFSEVKLFSRHVPIALGYVGFGAKTTVKEQLDRGRMWCSKFVPSDEGFGSVGQEETDAIAYVRLGRQWAAALARPLQDTVNAQVLDASYYTLSATGQWDDIVGAEHADHIMYQGAATPQVTSLRTNWVYGTNPVFCVGLWRGEANRKWLAAADQDKWAYATWVRFGGAHGDGPSDPGQFSIAIPYSGDQGVQLHAWNPHLSQWSEPLPLIEGSTPLQAPQGMPPGQRWYLWVACLRESIWLSADGFRSQSAGYRVPTAMRDAAGARQPVPTGSNVHSGPVWVIHTAGQWAATVYPIWMPNTGAGCTPKLWGDPVRTLYRIADNPHSVLWQAWRDSVVDDTDATVGAIAVTVQTQGDYGRYAEVTLEPVSWGGRCSDYSGAYPATFVSPVLYAVQITQAPHVYTTGQNFTSTTYNTRFDIDLAWREIGKPAAGRIALYNPGGVASGVQDYQRVQVRLGERFDDGTHTSAVVYTGYVVTPGDRQDPGQVNKLELRTFDAMCRLDDLKAIGDEPDFAGFTPDNSLKWLLGRALVPSTIISGTGSTGVIAAQEFAPEEDTWKLQLGRPYGEMAKKLLAVGVDDLAQADRGGALYLRYSAAPAWETWLRTRGPFTATGVTWTLRERIPADYGGSIYHVYNLERERQGANAPEYANYIAVIGQSQDGRGPLHGAWFDISSVSPSAATFGGGWLHTRVETDQSLRSLGAVFRRAQILASQIGMLREYVTVQTDLLPTVTYGQVFQLSGTATGKVAQASCNGARYRVEQFRHTLRVGTMARTDLVGRRLAD